jgi:hypothetical protein
VAYSVFGGMQPKEYYTATGNEPLEKRLSYTYDAYGDIIGLTNDAGECTIFIWDHKAHLPIAKIEGATFASLHEVIGEELFQSLFDDRCNTSVLQTVRDILANTPYQMTDYRHTPLVGVNSIKQPNTSIGTFNYDSMGRLIRMKENGATREEYQYNYRR